MGGSFSSLLLDDIRTTLGKSSSPLPFADACKPRLAYVVLSHAVLLRFEWDADARCLRCSRRDDDEAAFDAEARENAATVFRERISAYDLWNLRTKLSDDVRKCHVAMHRAIKNTDEDGSVPSLPELPWTWSPLTTLDELTRQIALLACEDLLHRATTQGWIMEMANLLMHQPLYEVDLPGFVLRCMSLPVFSTDAIQRLRLAAAERQATLVVRVFRHLISKLDDSPGRYMASVKWIRIGVGKDASEVRIRVAHPPEGVEPDERDAAAELSKLIAEALKPACEARGEACVGGRVAAVAVALRIVDAVSASSDGVMDPGEEAEVKIEAEAAAKAAVKADADKLAAKEQRRKQEAQRRQQQQLMEQRRAEYAERERIRRAREEKEVNVDGYDLLGAFADGL